METVSTRALPARRCCAPPSQTVTPQGSRMGVGLFRMPSSPAHQSGTGALPALPPPPRNIAVSHEPRFHPRTTVPGQVPTAPVPVHPRPTPRKRRKQLTFTESPYVPAFSPLGHPLNNPGEKLRLTEVKRNPRTTSTWQSWDASSGCLGPSLRPATSQAAQGGERHRGGTGSSAQALPASSASGFLTAVSIHSGQTPSQGHVAKAGAAVVLTLGDAAGI